MEKILLVINGAMCIDVDVVWTVVVNQRKTIVNSLPPKNRPLTIDFNNVLGSGVRTILVVVLQKKQHDGKDIKATALSIAIVEINDLLLAAIPS